MKLDDAVFSSSDYLGHEDLPVLILLKAIPMSPSDSSLINEEETLLASSTAWPVTVVSPILTVSVPTVPLAPDPSAYWMLQV